VGDAPDLGATEAAVPVVDLASARGPRAPAAPDAAPLDSLADLFAEPDAADLASASESEPTATDGGYDDLFAEEETSELTAPTPASPSAGPPANQAPSLLEYYADHTDDDGSIPAGLLSLGDSPAAESDETDAESTADSSRRRNFGGSGRGWLKVDISADGTRAVLAVLSFGGDTSFDRKDIVRALADLYDITSGIDKKMVDHLAERAAAAPTRVIRGVFPIAVMSPPKSADQAGNAALGNSAGDARSARLKAALARADIEAVLADLEGAPAVAPGQQLALGDMFGAHALTHPASQIREGDNVRRAGDALVSEIYGYACLLDGELSVISPLWTSPDFVEAHFIHCPRQGPKTPLVREWVDQLLALADVSYGIGEAEIARLLDVARDETPSAASSFLVASGKQAIFGEAARLQCTFDPDKWAGEHLPDGRVDFRERNAFEGVKKGQLLAEIVPAGKAIAGIDLRGGEIPAPADTGTQVFKCNHNVRTELEGDAPSISIRK